MDKNDQGPRESFDAKVRDALRAIPVPPNLRDRILSQKPVASVSRPVFWRPLLGLAAGIVLLLGLIIIARRQPAEDRTIAGFHNRMAAFAVRQYSMDLLTTDFSVLRGHLARTGAPADIQLPPGLRNVPLKGGAKLSWQGKPVAMVCFDAPDSKILYLFVVDSGNQDSPPVPSLAQTKGLASASWTNAGKSYFLAADLPPAEFERYL